MSEPGKYTIWLDYCTDGWRPNECDSLIECFDLMRSYAHSGAYRITRDVAFDVVEKEEPAAEEPATVEATNNVGGGSGHNFERAPVDDVHDTDGWLPHFGFQATP